MFWSQTGAFGRFVVKAIDLTNENVKLNFPDDKRHEAFVADFFDYMDKNKDKYDLIILDPPAFAKHRGALPQALKGYKRIIRGINCL